jgi:hypothetical protein
MPKQIITSSSTPTTGFTPGQSVYRSHRPFGSATCCSCRARVRSILRRALLFRATFTVQTRQTLDNLMKTPVLPKNHIRA